ncbi:MAG: hypothetical protein ACREFD_04260 [Stellaceae bacterium]
MIAPDIRAVADAILYEGYILYPYRRSALKNQQRWTFGGLFPKVYAERGGGDRWSMQCECLVRGDAGTRVGAAVRFLHIAARKIGRLAAPASDFDVAIPPPFAVVEELLIGERSFLPWEEAVPREWELPSARLGQLCHQPAVADFGFDASTGYEPLADDTGTIHGLIVRETESLRGRAILSAESVAAGTYKLSVRVENHTAIADENCGRRDLAARLSLASTHAVLTVADGAFVSMTDPPETLATAARTCVNEGCWPILVGADGTTDALLAAPIILYDYPKIAPESQSDLFDGTEIDEILILRVLTMTDAEKREMVSGDARAQRLLARLETLTPAEMGKLHGAWRSVTPGAAIRPKPELVSLATGGGALAVGERVRLKPRRGGDIMDLALAGKLAVIEAIERDFEDRVHVAVVLEDDPGREFGVERLPGHRFFFAPEEIERVAEERV